MADMGLGAFYSLATGQTAMGWASLGVNLIVSTLVGGIVLLIILQIISKAWGEPVKATSAFIIAFLINLINFFGIMGLIASYLPSMVTLFLPLIIWIVLIKVFFSTMRTTHAVITGIIGWLVSSMFLPGIISMVMGMIPV